MPSVVDSVAAGAHEVSPESGEDEVHGAAPCGSPSHELLEEDVVGAGNELVGLGDHQLVEEINWLEEVSVGEGVEGVIKIYPFIDHRD